MSLLLLPRPASSVAPCAVARTGLAAAARHSGCRDKITAQPARLKLQRRLIAIGLGLGLVPAAVRALAARLVLQQPAYVRPEQLHPGTQPRVAPLQLVLRKQPVDTRGVGKRVEVTHSRVEGHTHAARARVHAEGRLQQVVGLARHLDVQPRVQGGENGLLAPVHKIKRRDGQVGVERAHVQPAVHAGGVRVCAPARQQGLAQAQVRDGVGERGRGVRGVPGALLLEHDVDKVGLEQAQGALHVRVVGLLHAVDAAVGAGGSALLAAAEHVQVLHKGASAVFAQRAHARVADPAVDAASAREDPDAVAHAEVVAQRRVDDGDGEGDELPAFATDGGATAAGADVVVVGEVDVEHKLLGQGPHEALGDGLAVLGLDRVDGAHLEPGRVGPHHLVLELGGVLEGQVALVGAVLVLEGELAVREVVGGHAGVRQPLEEQVEGHEVLVVVPHVCLGGPVGDDAVAGGFAAVGRGHGVCGCVGVVAAAVLGQEKGRQRHRWPQPSLL